MRATSPVVTIRVVVLDDGALSTPDQIRPETKLEANSFAAALTPKGAPKTHCYLGAGVNYSIRCNHGEGVG